MAVARQYQGQPVALVAVNSGSSLSKVSDYAKKNKIAIPVIADVDRSLERSAGVGEISLKNIYQARALLADGAVVRTDARDLGKAMERASEGAAWNIDPTGIPDSMRPLWQAIEFGGYSQAAKPLAKMLKSRKTAEKGAAKKLNDYVEEQLTSRLTAAELNLETDPWAAWKQLSEIKFLFKGYKLPDSIDKNLTELDATENIKTERAALKQLGLAQKAAIGNASAQKRAIRILEKLIEKYPDTEAAKTASDFLQSRSGNGDQSE